MERNAASPDRKRSRSAPGHSTGALLCTADISVVETEKRLTPIFMDPYMVYLVRTWPLEPTLGGATGCALWRRYSEFELLRNYLMAVYPHIVMPPLPEKRINVARFQLAADKFDPDFIERRRQGLECFLLRLASHPTISKDEIFTGFLNQEEGWKESVQATHFQQKNDGHFKAFSASYNLKKPDRQFEDIRSYSDSLGTNISAILKIQQRATARAYAIAKLHGEYGKLFSEWSGIEKEMGDGLQKVGHQMDRFSNQLETILDEENVSYSDQLKEYYFFTESLKALVKKQHLKQYDLEKAEEGLSTKSGQRDELKQQINAELASDPSSPPSQSTGFSFKGLTAALFGAETIEAKEGRLNTLEEQVKDAEIAVRSAQVEINEYVTKALEDFERFRKQKVRDLSEVMQNYIKMQIKMCKLGLSSWQTMKDHISTL